MVLYFVYNLSGYSGAAQQALLLAKTLNIESVIINVTNSLSENYYQDDDVVVINWDKKKIINSVKRLMPYLLNKKVDICHFHGMFVCFMAVCLLMRKKIILKTTLLGDDDFDTLSGKKWWILKKYILNCIYKNIVLSDDLFRINAKYIDRKKIIKTRNGVRITDKCPELEEKKNIFCFVGLICKRKCVYESILYYIKHFSYLNNSIMYIIGPHFLENNNEVDVGYVEECKCLVERSSHKNKIIFTGQLSFIETNNILRMAKGLLFFSNNEGMPNVVLEAMSNNCIPITSEIGGVAYEMFEDRVSGFIVKNIDQQIKLEDIDAVIKNKSAYFNVKKNNDIRMISVLYENIYTEKEVYNGGH